MAVALQFVNVIVRKSAVQRGFPGGLDGLARLELPNYLEDEHLVRVGFMSTRDASEFVRQLESAGIPSSDEGGSNIAIITGSERSIPCWLSVGECDGHGACWLSGHAPGKLVDLDPCALFRFPPPAFMSVKDVERVLRQCGAEVRELGTTCEPATVLLECVRERALIEVEVFQDFESGRPVGLFGRRVLARRTSIAVDAELMREITDLLVSSGWSN